MSGGKEDRSNESGERLPLRGGDPPVLGDETGDRGGDITAVGKVMAACAQPLR